MVILTKMPRIGAKYRQRVGALEVLRTNVVSGAESVAVACGELVEHCSAPPGGHCVDTTVRESRF